MEDVLEVYQRPIDPDTPLVCLDEFSKQLLSNKYNPIPAKPGHLAKEDHEYVREGSSYGYMLAMPHLGKREVFMSEAGTHNSQDFAHALKHLSEQLPEAKKIVLVMDNFTTHTQTAVYKTFPPDVARDLCERFEWHYTPAHGSWLNMAEIEIGKITRSCLKGRVSSQEEMRSSIRSYLDQENKSPRPIKWQFDNETARVKLRSLYPSI